MVRATYEAPRAAIDFPNLVEFWRSRSAILRSSVIGFACGVASDVGAALASFFIAGILGYVLRRYGYSLPAIVMGVVLGQIGEEAFYQSIVLMDCRPLGFFEYPTATAPVLGAAALAAHLVRVARGRRAK